MSDADIMQHLESDWERLQNMSDDEIDYSDIPPLDEPFFKNAKPFIPFNKRGNCVQIDPDLFDWFKKRERDPKQLINLILRKYVEIQETPVL